MEEYNLTDIEECSLIHPNNSLASPYFQGAVYSMYAVIFVVALIGNSFVCYIVLSSPRMRTVTNYFILNLAVGDVLITILCVPFTSVALLKQYWPFGSFLCPVVNYCMALSVFVSAYTLVAISIDKYMIIMWPLKPRISKSFATSIIALVWVIAGITVLPTGTFATLQMPTDNSSEKTIYEQCNKYICREDYSQVGFEYGILYTQILTFLQYVIPSTVLLFTYISIGIVIWCHRIPGEAENSRDQRIAKSKTKKHCEQSIKTKLKFIKMRFSTKTENNCKYILKGPSLDYEPSPEGLGHEYYHSMHLNKNSIAQIDAETGEHDTYERLLQRCVRTALKMKAKNITKEDVVGLCSSNHLNSCVPIISSMFLGSKVAPLDPSLSLPETSHLLSLIKPKIIFVSSDAVNLIESALEKENIISEIIVFGKSKQHTEFQEFLEPSDKEISFKPEPIKSNKETAIILFSSGTTGLPKGICLSHYALLIQLANTVECWNYGNDVFLSNYTKRRHNNGLKVALGFTTYYWISAIGILNCSILTGITRIISYKFNPISVWSLIDKYNIDFLACASIQASFLGKVGKPETAEATSLRLLLTAGSPLSNHSRFQLQQLLPSCFITNAYGQTEICGAITMFNLSRIEDVKKQHEKPSSCGKLMPGISCKIVDPYSNKLLKANQPGELRYKANFMMNGYHAVDSSNAFDEDGYIKTGDIAFYDKHQCFYVTDRIKEMFKYKSWRIIPSLLESVIKKHPAVKNAIVIGIPHADINIGELPMAIVTVNTDLNEPVTEQDIKSFANSQLSKKYQLKGGLRIVQEILMTPTGKPKRREMREKILREMS